MKRSIGIMQGRLTVPNGRGIQFFPFENWHNEFVTAKEIGINEIEWIFDFDKYEENPLWTLQGIEAVKDIIRETGVQVRAICFDYFMRRAFYKLHTDKENAYQENLSFIVRIIKAGAEIGANLIEIPMVDTSSVKSEREWEEAVDFVCTAAKEARKYNIYLGLETDFPPEVFKRFLDQVMIENVKANYDSGNSSGLGYNHMEEIIILNKYIYNVHIKDRVFGGMTVDLGSGSADFEKVFSALKKINYMGSFILQAARAEEGKEKDNIEKQLKFLSDYIQKYQL